MIAHHERVEQGLGHDPLATTEVDDGSLRVGDVPVEVAVARHAPDRLGRDDGGVGVGIDDAAARSVDEIVVGDRCADFRSAAASTRLWLEVGDRQAGHLDQCVGTALGGGPQLAVDRRRERPDRLADEGEPLGIECAVEAPHPVEQGGEV